MNPKFKLWLAGLANTALHTAAKFGFLVIGVVFTNLASSVTAGHPAITLDWKTLLSAYGVGLIYGATKYLIDNSPFDDASDPLSLPRPSTPTSVIDKTP